MASLTSIRTKLPDHGAGRVAVPASGGPARPQAGLAGVDAPRTRHD